MLCLLWKMCLIYGTMIGSVKKHYEGQQTLLALKKFITQVFNFFSVFLPTLFSECQAVLREDPNLPCAAGASALQPGQRSGPPHPSLPPFPYWSQDGHQRCPSPLLATPAACHHSAAITAAHRLPRLM